MKNLIIIILLIAFGNAYAGKCSSCQDEAQKSHDAFKMIMPAAAIGLGTAFLLAGANHALGFNKHIDDGWFVALPLMFVTYELGSGMYHAGRVGIGISKGI